MKWIKAALAELFSLFVDDVWFSIAILSWIALGILEVPNLPIDPDWDAPLLFTGCAVILMVSTWRAARRSKKDN
jgi:hypothetical protein